MKYKKELKYLNAEINRLETFCEYEDVEFTINILEINFKQTFHSLKLFNIGKNNEIILNLDLEKPISEYLLTKYHNLSKDLNDIKLELISYLKKSFDLRAKSIASRSDFINVITKYKTMDDLYSGYKTYTYIIDKKIRTYTSIFRQLKNICILILKKKERINMSEEEMKLELFKAKIDNELSYVKDFLKNKNIKITNIVIRGDTNGEYDGCVVYVDKEQYSENLLKSLWFLLKLEFKKDFPLVYVESSEFYNLSPFSVDITPEKGTNIYELFKNKS